MPHSAHIWRRLLNGRRPRSNRTLGDVELRVGPRSHRYERKEELLARRAVRTSEEQISDEDHVEEQIENILLAMLAETLHDCTAVHDDLGEWDLDAVHPTVQIVRGTSDGVDATIALEGDMDRAANPC